jgi:hypothetical protein
MEIFGETELPAEHSPVRSHPLMSPGTRYFSPLVGNMRVIGTQYFVLLSEVPLPITSHSLSAQVQRGGCCTSQPPTVRPLVYKGSCIS